jgi:hypothetical protein
VLDLAIGGVHLLLIELAPFHRPEIGKSTKAHGAVNASLTVIGTCLAAMASSGPFQSRRSGPIASLLANQYAGDHSFTAFIAAIAPTADHYHESLATLRFAERINA